MTEEDDSTDEENKSTINQNQNIDPSIENVLEDFYANECKEQIKEIENNPEKESFVIDCDKLESFEDFLIEEIANHPKSFVQTSKKVIKDISNDLNEDDSLLIHVENYDYYDPAIRDLRSFHNGKLISVDCIVSKCTSILQKADVAAFQCRKCGTYTYQKQKLTTSLEYPLICANPECENTAERNFILNATNSNKIDFRKIEVQEPPSELEGGDTKPESETFNVQGEIANNVSAGDDVNITGIYKNIEQDNTSIFKTYIRGVNINVESQKFEEIEITPEEVKEIKELSNKHNIYSIVRSSIASELHGLEKEKEATMYQLFRGVRKTKLTSNIRGDIHVLFVGDPGVGKSQLLRFVSQVSPRGVMTTGKSTSEAGITAAAVRDSEFGGDDNWTLEAGALVIADNGIAAIDELDKMDPSDRSAMHEGLEQQTISVAKAGINSTLKSRCGVLGAANPKDGRWVETQPISQQIDLNPALISRFDLIFAPKDEPTEESDRKLAGHILETNRRGERLEAGKETSNNSSDVEAQIPIDLFKKYIAYARKNCQPVMTDEAKDVIEEFFVDIRREDEEDSGAGVPVTARKIEAIIRISEAAARIQLANEVSREHALRAVDIVKKSLRDVGYNPETGEFDADMMESEVNKTQRGRKKAIEQSIEMLMENGDNGAPKEKVIEELTKQGFDKSKIEHMFEKLQQSKHIFTPDPSKEEYRINK